MNIKELLKEIQQLQQRVADEISREARSLGYKLQHGRVAFEQEVVDRHREMAKKLRQYFDECTWLGLLVSPVVYSLIIPVVIFDLFLFVYQAVCFTVFKIPKVRRRDYIVLDRHHLKYLNLIERFNCVYCGYANGLIAYAMEIGSRSEQYWCPIKHARALAGIHPHYPNFVAYGNADEYVQRIEQLRSELLNMENQAQNIKHSEDDT
ncbi:MAG: hypothetical protein ACN4GM_13070 [Gammaproteobacteria bacterium]